ncbi:hypothetical protein B0O41_0736 [Propionibacteriaceae bacterium ES.041]|uniref:AlbA family DNA-binding domain-containing protein n=1 Tax=Enemella evansiae TaxID=2016499 RepID=UPI000B9652F2|nr:hypothetical protein [Enemella evansiae]OYO04597.1 hypothetical protein CGZ96_00130 [Enemella evansiae]PFG65959.1 hypothetical protein B0O41_0736 [Propionibacteriaceae bacterium ES.041]
MVELDLSKPPVGMGAAQKVIEAVAAVGDVVERQFEVKGPLDLSTKAHQAKIAKFILGAANRMPAVAAREFGGYGVLIIGVHKHGEIIGIPMVEMKDIDSAVRRFLGANGPRFDVQWVSVQNSTNHVLIIVVDPPQDGQPMFPCRASSGELIDGRIYFRAIGETREAKSEEIDQLLQRGAIAPALEVDITLATQSVIADVAFDANTIEEYIEGTRVRLAKAYADGVAKSGSGRPTLVNPGFPRRPERRTQAEYQMEIDEWERQFRAAWPAVATAIAVRAADLFSITLTNRTATFLEDGQLTLDLDGVAALFQDDYDPIDEARELPEPPRPWGPYQQSIIPSSAWHPGGLPGTVPPETDIANHETGTMLTFDIGALRPRATVRLGGDIVLLFPRPTADSVPARWTFTARGHHDAYTGELEVRTDRRDCTKAARRILKLDA